MIKLKFFYFIYDFRSNYFHDAVMGEVSLAQCKIESASRVQIPPETILCSYCINTREKGIKSFLFRLDMN